MKTGWRILGGTVRMALSIALMIGLGLVLNVLLCGFAIRQLANTADTPSLSACAAALEETEAGYILSEKMERTLQDKNCWAMLLDGEGRVVWQQDKPDEVPDQFSLAQVAGFTRWYLMDYPVRVRMAGDGLLVIGAPKNTVWKYDVEIPLPTMLFWPMWIMVTAACNVLLILLLSVAMTRRRYQQRDAARTEWIAAVSHDVRTPLSMVLGYADSLENDAALPTEQREQAALIRQKGEELRGLIADLNLTNRLMHSMEPLQAEWLSPAALVREAAAECINALQDDRYAIEVQIAPNAAHALLYGDRALLMRMLKNLLGNSMRHNPRGCTVTVTLCMQRLGLQLAVGDNGSGYTAAQLQALSERSTAVTTGRGLGLTIVRQIVAAHHGRIRFRNNAAGGAYCSIRFGILCVRRNRPLRAEA